MVAFGYTLMTEQAGPRDLVRHAVAAEEAGFDFLVMSDHYSPWLVEQGHAPYAWTVLGAVAQATQRIPLMTYVTCPTLRYHPAVVAQKAATVQELSEGRFTLGLGSGENLNEHVVGAGWPAVHTRHEMLAEAMEIISALFDGDLVDYRGEHFQVDSARLWDLPSTRVPVGLAVGGPEVSKRCAALADHLIAVEPDADLVAGWNSVAEAPRVGPDGNRAIGQTPISWDPADADAATRRAHDQFRWFGGGWAVNSELRPRRASPRPRSSCAARTSPPRSRVVPTSTRSQTGSGPSGRPGSPTSLSSRSTGRRTTSSWPRRPDPFSTRCARRRAEARPRLHRGYNR